MGMDEGMMILATRQWRLRQSRRPDMRTKSIKIDPHSSITLKKPKDWFPTIKLFHRHINVSTSVTIQTRDQMRRLIKYLSEALNEDTWGEYCYD